MKKITLTILFSGFAAIGFSQVTAFTTAASFESAFTGEMVTENFTNGPADPAICGFAISSAGDDCFMEGGVVPGFALSASNNSEVVYLPAGFLPSDNPTPRLGANSGVETTIITFTGTNVYAVGHSLYVDNSANFNYKVYNTANVVIYDETIPFSAFYGVVSTEPIGKVEIKNANDAGELIGDLQFGTENLGLQEHTGNQLVPYPNPVSDILTIKSAAQIKAVRVVNMLGQVMLQKEVNAADMRLDLSALHSGNYVLLATFQDGSTTPLKIAKK